jgi:hypothetical protein
MVGKYNRPYLDPGARPRPWTVHPIWRGIGCLLIILLPILSYAGANLLVRANLQQGWVAFPSELLGTFNLPFLGQVYLADLAVTLAMLVIGFALLTLIYGLVYRLIGPSRYGPLDAPPPRKRRTRS